MAQMNRSYGSDIQNLLDVAVRYKTAQDEKDYRNAALLAEKGYREQRDKLELSITAINLLSKQNDEIDSDIDKLEPILMKYGIDTQKIKEKVGKDISPDTNEIISTADNSVESIMSGLQSKKEFNAQYLNAIQQEATRASSLAIQYEGIYSRILSDTKNQSFKDRYADITPEELQSAISGGKFFEGDQQLTPDELKRVYSAVSTMGREDFAELSKHIEPITEYKDGKVITSYHPTTDIVDREFTGVPPADRQTDTDKRNAVVADLIREAMIKFDTDPGGTMSYIRSNIIGTNQNLSYLKGSGKNKDAQNAFKKAMTYFVNRYGTQSINPIQPTEQTATPVEIDFSKYEEP